MAKFSDRGPLSAAQKRARGRVPGSVLRKLDRRRENAGPTAKALRKRGVQLSRKRSSGKKSGT